MNKRRLVCAIVFWLALGLAIVLIATNPTAESSAYAMCALGVCVIAVVLIRSLR